MPKEYGRIEPGTRGKTWPTFFFLRNNQISDDYYQLENGTGTFLHVTQG